MRSPHAGGRNVVQAALLTAAVAVAGCRAVLPPVATAPSDPSPPLKPAVVTDPVLHDSDDPAIWVNATDPARSLVLGTDKDADGALYAFDLAGKIVKRIGGLKRPNNVDVEYGVALGGREVDIAAVTERLGDTVRFFRLPDLEPLDGGGGVPVFAGESDRAPMGVALYKRPRDGAVFAIVSRKSGPRTGYLWQYRLGDDGAGRLQATKVRAFGAFSGSGEIEAVAVDDALGYVYYSDESTGVRKYHADPDAPGAERELALFATTGFAEDREGISIYESGERTGYILVSDQQANRFQMFPREGTAADPHAHAVVRVVAVSAADSDGSDVTNVALGAAFPRGLFVAMSEGKVFHFYAWPDVAGENPATHGGRGVPRSGAARAEGGSGGSREGHRGRIGRRPERSPRD
jgi:3-phytase